MSLESFSVLRGKKQLTKFLKCILSFILIQKELGNETLTEKIFDGHTVNNDVRLVAT